MLPFYFRLWWGLYQTKVIKSTEQDINCNKPWFCWHQIPTSLIAEDGQHFLFCLFYCLKSIISSAVSELLFPRLSLFCWMINLELCKNKNTLGRLLHMQCCDRIRGSEELWCLTLLSNHRLATSHWQTLSHNVVSCIPRHERTSN
jgi:hypothetical protein